jgi:hypothetical protein
MNRQKTRLAGRASQARHSPPPPEGLYVVPTDELPPTQSISLKTLEALTSAYGPR